MIRDTSCHSDDDERVAGSIMEIDQLLPDHLEQERIQAFLRTTMASTSPCRRDHWISSAHQNYIFARQIYSLPTKYVLCPLFYSLPRPPSLPDPLILCLAFYARTVSGGSEDLGQLKCTCWERRKWMFWFTIAVSLSPQRTQQMADNYWSRQSRTGGGPKFGPANVSSCCWQADRKWRHVSHGFDFQWLTLMPGRSARHKIKTVQGCWVYILYNV